MKSAHRISDRTPSTMTRVTGCPCAAPATASRNAYNGEVPISPKTTPILPSVRAQKPDVTGPSRASADVTLTVMMLEKRSIGSFDPVRLSTPLESLSTDQPRHRWRCRDCPYSGFTRAIHGNIVVRLNYGFRSGG